MPRRKKRGAQRALAIFASLMLTAGLSGCLKSETSASLLAEARQYLQRGDTKSALIQLRNAASKSPEDAEIRYLLASSYNENNDPAAAEKEIRKALSLSYDRVKAMPQLVRALVALGKAQEALDESAGDVEKGGAALQAARAGAWLALGQRDKAKQGFEAALAAQPGMSAALLGLASLATQSNDLDTARKLAEQAVVANPRDAGALHFKGMLLRRQGKNEEALDTLGLALALQPDHLLARVERIDLEVAQHKYAEATADIDVIRKNMPDSLYVNYLQAVLEFNQGSYPAAQADVLKVLKAAPGHMPSLLLAGANELKLGNPTSAQGYLNGYLERNPDSLYARKLLAQALLLAGQPADAAVALQPMLRGERKDTQLLVLAGEAHLRNKDFQGAQQYFEKAAALLPGEATLHTSLGLAQLGQGQYAKAVEQLERAATLDPKSEQAALYLIRTEMGLRRYNNALAAVKNYQAHQKDTATVRNLEGGIYLAQGNRAAARAAFEKAVALQPDHLIAIMNLAQLDLEDKKPEAARQRLESVLRHDKHHIGAMTALADLAFRQGKPEETVRWLEQAVAEQPKEPQLGLRLARAYMQAKQNAKATTLARQLQVDNANNPLFSELLGQAQLANDDGSGALESYGKMVQQDPKSASGWFGMATAHLMLKIAAAVSERLGASLDAGGRRAVA